MTEFDKLFSEKTHEMKSEDFMLWLSAAYGCLTANIEYNNKIPQYKKKEILEQLKSI